MPHLIFAQSTSTAEDRFGGVIRVRLVENGNRVGDEIEGGDTGGDDISR